MLKSAIRLPIDRLNAWKWLPWLIFLFALAMRLIPGPRTIDDAYITYRYAGNILAGNGFVFNPGEQVLGTTTPLYTILLVLCGSIFGAFTSGSPAPFPVIAWLLNAAADGLTCWLLFKLGERLGSRLAGLGCALAWAVAPYSVTFSIGGLETSLYVLLLVATTYLHLKRRHIQAAFLAALTLLTRPDALILLGPLGVDRFIQLIRGDESAQRGKAAFRQAIREISAFLVPVSIWLIFASGYFGSPLPHSITAKTLAYRLDPLSAFTRLLQHYNTPFMDHLTFGVTWIGVGMVLYPFLFLVGSRYALKQEMHSWPLIAYPWLYLITFAAANPLIFRWYLTPPLPFYMLFILIGAWQILLNLGDIISRKITRAEIIEAEKKPGRLCQAILVLFVIAVPSVLLLRGWVLHPDHGPDRPAPDMAWYKLELLYRQAADTLAPEMLEQARIGRPPVLAAGDVGVLGYFTPALILDTVGLNSPISTSYYPLDPAYYVINYAVSPDLIMDQLPDYIVILEVYGRAGLFQDKRFWQVYELRQKIPTNIYGSDGMLILQKVTE